MKLIPSLHYTQKYSKCIICVNVIAKTIKLLEKNISINFYDLGSVKAFLDATARAKATKEEINKLDVIKI